jgi:hypothetical protein
MKKSEIPAGYRWRVEHRQVVMAYRPQQNGKVERSHRIDDEDFWQHQAFAQPADAEPALHAWEHTYNSHRFSMALGGLTPAEKLRAKLALAGPTASVGPGLLPDPPLVLAVKAGRETTAERRAAALMAAPTET